MNKIHILNNILINKIAAGEVIERPASVVKELVENSIDAIATTITIEIKGGGVDFIKVTDNGSGIYKDDVKRAFARHSTSKIDTFEDLEQILTLGFRGEALSSICSVSQVEMITKTKDEKTGIKIELHGGDIVKEQETAANNGTVFTMKNLFFNTPARHKFLKKVSAESSAVSDIVNKLALGHPEISFKYINNGTTSVYTSGNNDLKSAAFSIYGKELVKKMIEIEYEKNGYHINGLIGKPEANRANRNYENFFINKRFVKSKVVRNAVEEAFKGKLMVGKFPVFIINMTVPKSTVDVNVHPTKLEVRFSDDDFVHNIIFEAVSNALKNEILIPKVSWDNKEAQQLDISDYNLTEYKDDKIMCDSNFNLDNKDSDIAIDDEYDYIYTTKPISSNLSVHEFNNTYIDENEFNDTYIDKDDDIIYINNNSDKAVSSGKISDRFKNKFAAKENKIENKKVNSKSFFYNYNIIGQIFNTYWIVEQNNSIYIIDQHAAHERILYEKFVDNFKKSKPMSQRLLQPIAVNLSESEKQIVCDNKELLESFGFELEEFGVNTYAVRSVPFIFNSPVNADFFVEIIDLLSSNNISNIYETKLDAIATMSCKAAVKGNNKLSYKEAKQLIEEIVKIENPFTCPHGRPTIIEISKHELEKRFKRIQS